MTDRSPATAPHTGAFLDDYLLYLLAAASEEASAQFHKVARAAGLRVPEWRVLASLHDQDGAMVTRLAKLALVEQSRLTKIIAQMETRGLVLRKNDPQDGRRVRVFLTTVGRELVTTLVPKAKAHDAHLMEKISSPTDPQLKDTLRSLLSELSKTKESDFHG